MPYRKVVDGNGKCITLFDRDGRLFPTHDAVKYWQEVTSITSRDSDILLCGYAKSGLHWLWEIVTMLTNSSSQVSTSRMEAAGLLMFASASELDKLPSPRVLTTHRLFHELPSDFILKQRKIVCILRDPKDVCVSAFHMMKAMKHSEYEGTFEGFLSLFLEGHIPGNTWANWVLSYEKGIKEHPELSVHVVRYEHLKANPVGEIQRLAEYLGVVISNDLVQTVAQQTEFSALKASKEKMDNPFLQRYKNEVDPNFRKGEVGQWKQWFTSEQIEQFHTSVQTFLGRPSLHVNL